MRDVQNDGELMLSTAEARPLNINALVEHSLMEVLRQGVHSEARVFVDLDTTLPRLFVLQQPVQDALRRALVLCLQAAELSVVVVRTLAASEMAVVSIERCSRRRYETIDLRCRRPKTWHEVGSINDLDLLVGQQVLRALGGRLWLLRRPNELRAQFELPLVTQGYEQSAIDRAGPVQEAELQRFVGIVVGRAD